MPDRQRVLVADDEAPVRALVADVLEAELGVAVYAAADGDAALRAVAAAPPALLLLDLRMPGRDGFEVLRLLKSRPETARVPVLALTATAASEVARALDGGCAGFVAKPFDLDVLVATVRPFLAPAA
jgi:CheY-like chemotaxis protein